MPSAAFLAKLKADPARWADYCARRLAYREQNRERLRSEKNIYDAARREIRDARAVAAAPPALDQAGQLAVYERALRMLPRSIPLEIRRSYAADALLGVIDGTIPLNFSYADLHPLRLVDLPMDWSGQFILLGAVTEDDKGLLAGLY